MGLPVHLVLATYREGNIMPNNMPLDPLAKLRTGGVPQQPGPVVQPQQSAVPQRAVINQQNPGATQLADALLKQGMQAGSQPVQTHLQGIGQVLAPTLMGAWMKKKSGEDRSDMYKALAGLSGDELTTALVESGDEELANVGLAGRLKRESEQRAMDADADKTAQTLQSKLDLKKLELASESGPFKGTGINAQDSNILVAGKMELSKKGFIESDVDREAYNLAMERTSKGTTFKDPLTGNIIERPGVDMESLGYTRAYGSKKEADEAKSIQSGTGGNGQKKVGSGLGPQFNEFTAKTAGFASRLLGSLEIIDRLEGDPTFDATADILQINDKLHNIFASRVLNENQQMYVQAKYDAIMAILRPESGALISEEEIYRRAQILFPMPGEKGGVLSQKQEGRMRELKTLVAQGGDAFKILQPDSFSEYEKRRAYYDSGQQRFTSVIGRPTADLKKIDETRLKGNQLKDLLKALKHAEENGL